MCTYVCMYVRMYVCMYVCMYYIHAHMYNDQIKVVIPFPHFQGCIPFFEDLLCDVRV